jgi:hypothetical protein
MPQLGTTAQRTRGACLARPNRFIAAAASGHRYYAQVKDRKDGKRAAFPEARKILRQACRILAGLGDDALSAA